jgi:DNA-binding transcriptional LysR family regulator
LAVARELHFGRAAAALHIAQPALSQSIRTLETQLGARVLERTNRRVELTPAGRVLRDDAEAILASVERAIGRVRAVGEGRAGLLRIAYTRSASEGVSIAVVEAFRARHPDVEIQADTLYTARNVLALRDGEIDAAFVRTPLVDPTGLSLLALGSEPFVVVLPVGHRLARRRRVRRAELRDEPLVTGARERGPGFFDTLFREVWGDATPRIVQIDADEEHMLRAVSRGVGVTVITASRAAALRRSGLVVRRFEAPEPSAPLALAWRCADASPLVSRFVAVAGEFCAEARLTPARTPRTPAAPRAPAPARRP